MNKETIINLAIFFSAVALFVLLLWYMLGNSPTVDQLLLGLIIPLYLFIFGIYEKLNNKIMNIRELFIRDMGEMKVSLARIEEKLSRRGTS